MDNLISFHDESECIAGDGASQQLTITAASPPQSTPRAVTTPGAVVDDSPLIDLVDDAAHDQEAPTQLSSGITMATGILQPSSTRPQSNRAHGQRRSVTPIGVRLTAGPLIKQWADARLYEARKGHWDDIPRRGHANFFISHDPGLTSGIIDAIHTELSQIRSDIAFKIRGGTASPYLSIDAPSEDLAVECVRLARTLADEMISDKTVHTTAFFLEPPGLPLDSVEVKLEHFPTFEATRPCMLPCSAIFSDPSLRIKQEDDYMNQFCIHLSAALKRVGRINSDFNLKVNLGHFFLMSFPHATTPGGQSQGPYKFGQFSSLVRNPRATGEMKPQIGNLHRALQVLRAIRRDGSPFSAQSFSIPSAAKVPPTFILEARSSQHRIEAHLQPAGDVRVGGKVGQFKVAFIKVFNTAQKGSGAREMGITTLSLGREFDWKIETVNETPEDDRLLQGLKGELRSAKISVPQSGNRLDEFPRFTFRNPQGPLTQLNTVAIKSVYRFMFSSTYYVVEFTIRREWESIMAMTGQRAEPLITFGTTVYGEHWGETRASEIAKTGRGWGEELEILFSDELGPGSTDANGQTRVRAFVETINAIRDALSVDL